MEDVLLVVMMLVTIALVIMVMMTGVQIMTDGNNNHGGDFDSGNDVLRLF